MKKAFAVLLALILGIAVAGCSIKSRVSPEEQVLAVVQQNLDAFNKEDVDGYMKTMDVENVDETVNYMKQLFSQYDLKAELSDMKVTKIEGNEAEVSCVQITKKISGPDFQNNKTTAVHYLKKVNGEWKIYKTEAKSSEPVE
jgi:ketosteroid isomerase-like protein